MGSGGIPNKINPGNVVQHLDDLHKGGIEDAEAHLHAGAHAIPLNLPIKPAGGPKPPGPLGGFGGPSVPSYGKGGGALTAPGAKVTLAMLQSLDDPSSGAVLGQCMMLILKDAIQNRQGARKDVLQAGLAKVGNAIAAAANEALQSKHQRADLAEKAGNENTAFMVGMVCSVASAACSVAGGAMSGSGAGSALSGIGTSIGMFNTAFGHLTSMQNDEVDLNSKTWDDKARGAHLDVLKAINETESQSAQAGLDDASDGVKDARQMVTSIIQAKKDMQDKSNFSR